jgi:transposase-like protein
MNIPRAVVGAPRGATPAGDDQPLTVSAVARRVGVGAATLGIWDQRFGVGPHHPCPGGSRRYTTLDVLRVELLQQLVLQGEAPAEAARRALAVFAGTPVAAVDCAG